jgi:cytochrome c-type biogenesis protein
VLAFLTDLTTVVAATGERVRDGSLLVAVPISAAAGLVSFLSPCVLPLVPGYLSFVTGMSASEIASADVPETGAPRHPYRRILLGTLGFVFGFSVVFVSFGAAFGGLGRALQANEQILTRVFGVITIVLGLVFAGVFSRVPLFNRDLRVHRVPAAGVAGAPVLGAMFAFGWTPCIGPTLSAVLGLAASSDQASAWRGAFLSLWYCLGLGIPFLLSGLAFQRAMSGFRIVKQHYRVVMLAGGGMLVVIGVLQVTGAWSSLVDLLQDRVSNPDLPI